MLSDAARILKVAGRKGKQAVGYQGLRLATIQSVEPFKMVIDDVGCEFLAEDVLVNAQMLDFTYQGTLTAEQAEIKGQINISGSGSVGGYGGSVSINNASSTMNGNINTQNLSVVLKKVFKANDRVAVASVGVNKFLIICKAVMWQ